MAVGVSVLVIRVVSLRDGVSAGRWPFVDGGDVYLVRGEIK